MLYIVATPIGNLDDISARAILVLKNATLILAEDGRHSKKLLAHYDIKTKVRSFFEHNEVAKTAGIIKELTAGKNIALISDAGTPLISDPGYVLVAAAIKAGITISPIPGANAAIAALSVSGISANSFSFFGFLPSKQSARLKAFHNLLYRDEASIFYESPKRILASLIDLQKVIGDTRICCLAKEISKTFETIKTGFLPNLINYLTTDEAHQKGEFVLIIAPVAKKNNTSAAELHKILTILLAEMGAAKAAKIASKLSGIDKKTCYQTALKL